MPFHGFEQVGVGEADGVFGVVIEGEVEAVASFAHEEGGLAADAVFEF